MARDQRPRFPPSLSRVPTELDRLYTELGGPIKLMPNIDRSMFVRSCEDFPRAAVEPILSQYCADTKKVGQVWPWVAFAADQYRFERENRKRQANPEPTPTDIVKIVDDIEKSAEALVSASKKLRDLANRLEDPTAPLRRPRLAYIDQLIAQAAAGILTNNVIEHDEVMASVHFRRLDFLERIELVQATAHEAKSLVSTELLKRPSGQPANVALINLVRRIGKVSTILTGKKPSGSPIKSSANGQEPPFVRLVAAIAKMADDSVINTRQVEIVLLKQKGKTTSRKPKKRRTSRKRQTTWGSQPGRV